MCNVYCMSLICSVATDRLSEYCFPTWDSCTVCSRDRCSLLYSCESPCERLLLCRKELHWADASLLKWHHISPFIFPLVLHLTALAVSILKALCGELSQWVHFTGARLWQLGAHELGNRTSSRARAFIPPQVKEFSGLGLQQPSFESQQQTPISACVALLVEEHSAAWICQLLQMQMTKWSCVGCWLSSQPVPAISSHKHWTLCLRPYRAPAITEPFLCSPPSTVTVFRGLFFSCSLSLGVYCACFRVCLLGKRRRGSCLCGFYKPSAVLKEMLSKLGGGNINPSVPYFTDCKTVLRFPQCVKNDLGDLRSCIAVGDSRHAVMQQGVCSPYGLNRPLIFCEFCTCLEDSFCWYTWGDGADCSIYAQSASGTCFYCKRWIGSPFYLLNWLVHPVYVAASDNISLLYDVPKLYGSVL